MTSQLFQPVRLRFAPSPTGYLHVGGARTALYNWLYAKKLGGVFVLRIEDTDQARSTEAALQMQMGDLKWLGLEWQEGPIVEGPFTPYKQSERRGIYKEHADRLFASGKAYYCFCTDEELEKKKEIALKLGRPPQYDGKCRTVTREEAQERIAKGEKATARFNIGKPKDYVLNDLIRGDVHFPAGMVGDFVMLRSDGMPVYNFCCVIDDALMQITHVLRAEEHLPNTVRQMMLYEAFGYQIPKFGHLSFIVDEHRQKLSKRSGATSCNEFRQEGYLPEALLNYVALLGWSSPTGEEIMSIEKMISVFELDRFTSSPAAFDYTKLKWLNATHLRALPHDRLWKMIEPFLKEAGLEFNASADWIEKSLSLLKTSMETLKDAVELYRPLLDSQFQIFEDSREVMSFETTPAVLKGWIEGLKNHPSEFMSEAEFLNIQNNVKDKTGAKGKQLFQPIRVAVIGRPQGAELKQLVPLISKTSLIARAEKTFEWR
jgi:nondiscriminating glutamyl-tRNA synthetase